MKPKDSVTIIEKTPIRVAVREVAEFVHRSGSIVPAFRISIGSQDAIEAHQTIQDRYGEMHQSYEAELTVTTDMNNIIVGKKNYTVSLTGRMDGFYLNGQSMPTIHEIKTTLDTLSGKSFKASKTHWAQLRIYAYMYMKIHDLTEIAGRLTYYNPELCTEKYIDDHFQFEATENFVRRTLKIYVEWQNIVNAQLELSTYTISEMKFPFEYRKGQRQFVLDVYDNIKTASSQAKTFVKVPIETEDSAAAVCKKLYIQAPTGTGKTLSTLYPTVKALGKNFIDRAFYFTAKNITRNIAEGTIDIMRNSGLNLKTITIHSKESCCKCRNYVDSSFICIPEQCQYAEGYFDRIRVAIKDIYTSCEHFSFENLIEFAEKHKVCPFEFSLDLSLWCKIIICDYNYLFDPQVSLGRFFEMPMEKYCYLIDEAHNLVDRARDMYSAELSVFDLGIFQEKENAMLKTRAPMLLKNLTEVDKLLRHDGDEKTSITTSPDVPEKLIEALDTFTKNAVRWLTRNNHSEAFPTVLKMFYACYSFYNIAQYYNERYVTIYSGGTSVRLFCLDPCDVIATKLDTAVSASIFSATLTPAHYFTHILGGKENSHYISLPTPFPPENFLVCIDNNTTTKFAERATTYDKITIEIYDAISSGRAPGRYLVFSPSFDYLQELYARFYAIYAGKADIIKQYRGMTTEAQNEFLMNFDTEANDQWGFSNELTRSLVGFAVMGGIFGEGIDLKGDRLSGVIIVGVGLPGISFENDLIKDYFDTRYFNGTGFDYAYTFPGFNKVMQALGRVIRTEEDTGFALLIDERYATPKYRSMFSPEWKVQYLSPEKAATHGSDDFAPDFIPDYESDYYYENESSTGTKNSNLKPKHSKKHSVKKILNDFLDTFI